MKSLLTGIATGVAVIVIAMQLSKVVLLWGASETPQEATAELPPPMMAPLYLPGERETADAQFIHEHCLYVARSVDGSSRHRPLSQARNTEYLACYIGELEEQPRRLCDRDTRNRLTRYTRGYFAFLKQRQADAETPQLAPMIKMQRDLTQRSDIISGANDFSPDPRVIEGLQALVREGALPRDLEASFEPEVPHSVLDALARIKPAKALCS